MITRKRVTAFLVALLVCVGFILPMPANAVANEERATTVEVLQYWHSQGSWIGEWLYPPTIFYYAYRGDASNIPLTSGIQHAKNQWSDALGISLLLTTNYSSESLRFYGITRSDFNSLYPGATVTTNVLGKTFYNSLQQFTTYAPYNTSSNKSGYYLLDVDCYCFYTSGQSTAVYTKTITHELGHGLGWNDHPRLDIEHSTWVMKQGGNSYTTLKTGEIQHLAQVYND